MYSEGSDITGDGRVGNFSISESARTVVLASLDDMRLRQDGFEEIGRHNVSGYPPRLSEAVGVLLRIWCLQLREIINIELSIIKQSITNLGSETIVLFTEAGDWKPKGLNNAQSTNS